MFIRRREFEALKARVEALEKRDYSDKMFVDSCDESRWRAWEGFCPSVPTSSVVREICRHLGMKITKTELQPAATVLVKAKGGK